MSRPPRIGVIGTGQIARTHVVGYQVAGADIVAVADVNSSTLAARQREWGVATGYAGYRDLLADPAVDAVSICTPNSTHYEITMAAAQAGKHVLCEKPISLDLAQADEMIEACSRAGVVFQVGHHMRSWAAAARSKAMIERGDLGAVAYVRLRQAHDWGGARTPRGAFGSRAASGGGTLLDNGCHLFDLARYLGGDVSDVFARIATLKFEVEVEDTAIASLGYASGAMGQIEVAWTGTGWQEAFWVFGTEGSLECDNRIGENVLTHRFRGSSVLSWSETDIARYELHGLDSHSQNIADFLAAIDGTGPIVCTGADGREAVRLVQAAYASADAAAPIRL